jgi:hypothetical protein
MSRSARARSQVGIRLKLILRVVLRIHCHSAVSHNLIPASIQFEYDPGDLATKVTTRMVHKSNSKTYV